MSSSSNRATRAKRPPYSYTESTSPWRSRKRFLFFLWASELIGTIFVSAFGSALYKRKETDWRHDDGISQFYYAIILFMVGGATVVNFIFLPLQVIWYIKRKLHPGWMLGLTTFNALAWFGIIIMTFISITQYTSVWQIYEAVLLFDIFVGVIFIFHFVFSWSIFSDGRRAKRENLRQQRLRRQQQNLEDDNIRLQ